ncbi:MAG TPA: hypothetical protein VIY72_04215 [Acidimicrobiales bacterium]
MTGRARPGHGRVWLVMAGVVVVSVVTVASVGALVSGGSGSSGCPTDHTAPARIATYEWRESAWRSAGARQELVRTAQQLCLDRLYVDITAAATATGAARELLRSDVAALVETAREASVEVGAVAGDPWWPSPQGHVDASSVVAFVDELHDRGAALASLHVDAEPWGLEEWPTMKSELTTAYLEFVEHLEAERGRRELETPLVYLIPYWFDGSNGEAPLISVGGRSAHPFQHMTDGLRPGAAVAVMAYRNRALGEGGIVDLVRQELAQEKVPVIVGVETAPIDPPTATFAGASLEELHEQLAVVARQTGTTEIVINDLPNLLRIAAPA